MCRKSIVLPFSRVKNDVIEFLCNCASDFLKDYMNGGHSIAFFESFHPLNLKYKETLDRWAEICSDDFFKNNPEIDDVLVVGETGSGKEWLASKDD